MTKLRTDYPRRSLIGIIGTLAFDRLKEGDDVTHLFNGDLTQPVHAVIIEKEGPGRNPLVEFTFMDEDQAWRWYSRDYGGVATFFDVALVS